MHRLLPVPRQGRHHISPSFLLLLVALDYLPIAGRRTFFPVYHQRPWALGSPLTHRHHEHGRHEHEHGWHVHSHKHSHRSHILVHHRGIRGAVDWHSLHILASKPQPAKINQGRTSECSVKANEFLRSIIRNCDSRLQRASLPAAACIHRQIQQVLHASASGEMSGPCRLLDSHTNNALEQHHPHQRKL